MTQQAQQTASSCSSSEAAACLVIAAGSLSVRGGYRPAPSNITTTSRYALRFTVTATGQRICFINTHFDHESEEARTRAAEFLIAKIPEVSLGLPVVVVGE